MSENIPNSVNPVNPFRKPDADPIMLDTEFMNRQSFAEDVRTGYELLFRRYYRTLCSQAERVSITISWSANTFLKRWTFLRCRLNSYWRTRSASMTDLERSWTIPRLRSTSNPSFQPQLLHFKLESAYIELVNSCKWNVYNNASWSTKRSRNLFFN